MIALRSVTNTQDGSTAAALITGTVNGPLIFYAAELPTFASAQIAAHTAGGAANTFVVTFPASEGWYLWATDNDGNGTPLGVWISTSNDQPLNEAALAVVGILQAQRPLIDAAILAPYVGQPNLQNAFKVKQIVYAYSGLTDSFPALIVMRPTLDSVPIAVNNTWLDTYSLSIYGVIHHTDEQSEVAAGTRMMSAALRILNKHIYRRIILPCGVELSGCRCAQTAVQENEEDPEDFAVMGTLDWRAVGQHSAPYT